MLNFLSGPWHWSVSGLAISMVMFSLLYAGKEFGVSSNLRTMCSIAGAGKRHSFFNFDWKAQRWNLMFIAGAVLGGFIAFYLVPNEQALQLSTETASHLQSIGIDAPQAGISSFVPLELFGLEQLSLLRSSVVLILGGFLVGFGARWAGGCTSGHAISGLSNLQIPSLIAVIGFFIGGLLMSWFILPLIVQI